MPIMTGGGFVSPPAEPDGSGGLAVSRGWKVRRPDPAGPGRLPRGAAVLVTGASGFIGAQVVKMLVERGCRVTAVVRPGSNPRRLADLAGAVDLVEGDV